MNHCMHVFAQISSFLPQRALVTLVSRFKGDYCVRLFTCWNVCPGYGEGRRRLRDGLRWWTIRSL